MSRGGAASGTGASRISTKPSGSTRATLTCSPSTRISYIELRRFPEALRKLDQVLDITPDDLDTLVVKAAIAQAEGDLPRASALLAPLHPAADDSAGVGNTSLPSDPGAPPCTNHPSAKGNTGQA